MISLILFPIRVTQPTPKKLKRKENMVKPEPVKDCTEKLEQGAKDYSSDEDIPLSLRRKIKKEQ